MHSSMAMGISRSDVQAFMTHSTTHLQNKNTQNPTTMERLPLARDFFAPMPLTHMTKQVYENMARMLLDDALDRQRKEKIYGGIDESWRNIGQSSGFKRYTKADGPEQHYRLQGSVRSSLSDLMTVMYAENDHQLLTRRTLLYGDCLDTQTLAEIKPRHPDNHHMTIRWQAINLNGVNGSSGITTSTNSNSDAYKFDMCQLEYTGLTTDPTDGTQIGFKICQSVDVTTCLSLKQSHGIARVNATEIFLLRANKTDTDVIVEGVADIARVVPPYVTNAYTAMLAGRFSKFPLIVAERHLSALTLCDKEQYVPFAERKNCSVCSTKFGMLSKKAHCGACGEVICKSCTVVRKVDEEVKVCKKCVIIATEKAEAASISNMKKKNANSSSSVGSSSGRHGDHHSRESSSSSSSTYSGGRSAGPAPQKFTHPAPLSISSSSASSSSSSGRYLRHPQPTTINGKMHVDMTLLDELASDPYSSSYSTSEDSYGSTSTTSTYILDQSVDLTRQDSVLDEDCIYWVDTKDMIRANQHELPKNGTNHTIGNRYGATSTSNSGPPFQTVEESIAHQRHILQEMMTQSQKYRPPPPPRPAHYYK